MEVRTNLNIYKAMFVFLLGIVCTAAMGRIITVDNNGSADFNNVQAAIHDCNDGDIIAISPGTYLGASWADLGPS